MSDHIHENLSGETWQSLLEHGKAKHLPLQAYEVAEFNEARVNYPEVIAVAVVCVVVILGFVILQAVR